MGGGLMQLVAYGAQDIYLTGNPQITFFKVVYRRHTNFSMETIQQTINGGPGDGGNSTVTISRNGDLVHKVYVTLAGLNVTKGSNIVKEVELEIGGQRIDRQYEEWMNIWNELSTPESKALALKAMQCDIGTGTTTGVGNVQVPLNFWFCRNPGLALPLIALQYHEVKLKFTWGSVHNGTVSNAKVFCDYIYLDTDERRRFAQVSHEYLIEQIQKETLTDASGDHKLNFNHPVKELIWTTTKDYTDAKLVLNGHDRFSAQEEEYFQLRQPFDYHTAVPHQNLPNAALEVSKPSSEVQFTGHTASGIYTGDAAGTGDGNLLIIENQVKFEGSSPPGFTDAFAGGFNLVIIPTESNSDARTGTHSSVVGKRYYVSVPSGPGKVIVSANAITFVTEGEPTALNGKRLVANTLLGGKYQVMQSTDNTHLHNEARTSKMTDKVNVYSFALKPEEHQPSGTCNFSRIDNAQLHFTDLPGPGNIYAVNYNVLRIMSGMGGLAYSN